MKSLHRCIRVRDVTIIVVDWLDVFIICIGHSTATSTEEVLPGSGMMSYLFKSDKKSLMRRNRFAMTRGI
ncbi:MAG TPA: hypothetical protein D7H90_05400 [Candidatus Poseidoniales archaeon]|nr:MAG TPA: hypothetical protein D7H90_05400 [Candidatus Poseidoniales archaeon]